MKKNKMFYPKLGNRKLDSVLETIFSTVFLISVQNYAIGKNPSQTFLEPILSFQKVLINSWQSNRQPPTFWFPTYLFGLMPNRYLEIIVFLTWILQNLILVFSFKSILNYFNLGIELRLICYSLIAITSLAGIGTTYGLSDVFYPSNFAFALCLLSVSYYLNRKFKLSGFTLGLISLFNPSTGLLALICIVIPILLENIRNIKILFNILIPFITLSLAPFYFASKNSITSVGLSKIEQVNLRLYQRMPHHYLYSSFDIKENLNFLFWSCILLFFLYQFRRIYKLIFIFRLTIFVIFYILLSALASFIEGPFLLIEIRASRLSPLITSLGIVAFCALLKNYFSKSQIDYMIVLVGLFVIFRFSNLHVVIPNFLLFFFENYIVFFLLNIIALRLLPENIFVKSNLVLLLRRQLFMIAILVVFFLLKNSNIDYRNYGLNSDLRELMVNSELNSKKGDIFLIPPTLDSFSYYTQRAAVVEWGPNPFGAGEGEYATRLRKVTGLANLFKDSFNIHSGNVEKLLDIHYESNINENLICQYKVDYIISRNELVDFPNIELIFRNNLGFLWKVTKSC